MKTRFDSKVWMTGLGEVIPVEQMETDHLLNTLKMLVQKPNRTINMIIRDIETAPDTCPSSPFGNGQQDIKHQSIRNVTSMTPTQLIEFALNSPLGLAMKKELTDRGVDVENYIHVAIDLK